jgi:hypothetical protein
MNAITTTFVPTTAVANTAKTSPAEKRHQRLVMLASLVAIGALVALIVYGAAYYRLSPADRAFSPKHHLLRPGGIVGINLGLLGVLMLCGIFLYPLRKRWGWLRKRGNSKHWLDHHVVLGVAAPLCIAFHASFKFHGLAGIAFLVMVAVSLSGLIGRYLYAQIPRQVAAAESSLLGFQNVLQRQTIVPQADLRRLLFRVPAPERVSHWSAFTAVVYIVASDVARPFRVAHLRVRVLGIKSLGIKSMIRSLCAFLPSSNVQLEEVISLACKQALNYRRAIFLSHAQRVFELWHVVHKPFSYAFAVLAIVHIGVAMLLGFI